MSIAEAEVTTPEPLFMVEDIDPRDAANERGEEILSFRAVAIGFMIFLCLTVVYSLIIGFPVVDALILYAFIAGPICFVASFSKWSVESQAFERRLMFQDGYFIWSTPKRVVKHLAIDCCWCLGNVNDDPTLTSLKLRGRSLILVFPNGRSVACGLTADKREEWTQLFKQVGCTQLYAASGWRLNLKIVTIATLFILGCVTAWYVGTLIVNQAVINQAIPGLNNPPFDKLLPACFAALVGWFFALLIYLLVPGCWQGTKLEKNQLMTAATSYSIAPFTLFPFFPGQDGVPGMIAAALLAVVILPTTYVICRI